MHTEAMVDHPATIKEALQEALRRFMRRSGLRQEDVAKLLRLSAQGSLSKWLHEKPNWDKLPTTERVYRLLKTYDDQDLPYISEEPLHYGPAGPFKRVEQRLVELLDDLRNPHYTEKQKLKLIHQTCDNIMDLDTQLIEKQIEEQEEGHQ